MGSVVLDGAAVPLEDGCDEVPPLFCTVALRAVVTATTAARRQRSILLCHGDGQLTGDLCLHGLHAMFGRGGLCQVRRLVLLC